ncbi:hypothetical protein P691DRAFT_824277 [Macrolepiota fuliginosa MF-IS2]|uniref:Uncharacterized protein n=1 Tax=Macrolepiota fuliginosa MF-IS2 TaxID=1400762 RepID=A0A9P5WYD6_9AGAR|nr:hypothetical protein P691DRAFT_824277 [Macrolepiota fuliginosa MF-IS2]
MDVPPAELHPFFPISTTVLTRVFGMLVTALFSGGLITLGITCIFLLSPKGVNVVRRRLRRTYIIVLLLANVGYQTTYFLDNTLGVMYLLNPKKRQVLRILAIICDVGHVDREYDGCGFLGCVGGGLGIAHLSTASIALQTTAISSSILLNLYTTIYIAVRLLLHRPMVIACVGKAALTENYLPIISILLESAAINVPVTIAGAVGIAVNRLFGSVVLSIAVTCQSLASVLILLRVTLGRAIDQQCREDTEESIASGTLFSTPSISGSSIS